MDALVRTTWRQLILDHGRTLSADPRRCEAMLKDYCPAHRREIAALIVALRARVATDLLAPPAGQPTLLLINRLVQRVLDDHPMTEDAARWAVETWALALGVIDAPLAPLAEPAPATGPAPRSQAPKPTPAPAVHTPPKTADPGPPDIHGWPADQVQALQRQAAALGMPAVIRDPDFLVPIPSQVKIGERQRWFRDPEPIYEERTVVTAVAPPQMVIIPVPVGSLPANLFGLYEILGNTYEWLEDCWHADYNGAPTDGSAWRTGDCIRRVLRGGSWRYGFPEFLRSASRDAGNPAHRNNNDVGFRAARTLTL